MRTGQGIPDVVVTAVASTTALAPDAEDTWQQLLQGRSGIRTVDKDFVEKFTSPVRIGGELCEHFDEHLSHIELRRLSFMQKMSRVLGRRLWDIAGSPDVDTTRLLVSIAQAWQSIVLGEADIAICGGVDALIEAVPVAAFTERGMLSANNDDPSGACRSFDKDRDGMVFGEGGALMLIENEEHAKARGADILARVMGAAITSDCYDVINPDPSGERASYAITHAIELAGLSPKDIDHVNAHATGTRFGDLAEAHAIRNALDGHAPAVYAPKAALGQSWGAAGAIEAVLTVQALRDGVVPPTLNLKNMDPEVDLDVVAGEPRRGTYRYAVSNSLGFGGHNVALVFGAY